MSFGGHNEEHSNTCSTGSIGIQTLDIVREHKDEINITALVANTNILLMEEQIRSLIQSLCVSMMSRKQSP